MRNMDLSDPTRAITPTLDGTVLAVLASAGRPLTVGEVAAQTVRGSEIGVRRSLGRLMEQGIVRSTEIGRNRVHELNRDHIAAPIADLLSRLRIELWGRLRQTIARWRPSPVYACVFGSAARGDGGPDSDIAILIVHPPFPGEKRPQPSTLRDLLGNLALDLAVPISTEADITKWNRQVERLHTLVQGWTGNPLQLVDVSAYEWTRRTHSPKNLWEEISRDAIILLQPSAAASVAEKSYRGR
jgi:predicted nucleotidyltransferase